MPATIERATDLVRAYPLRPITSEGELISALEALDRVFDAEPDTPAAAYRELLAQLIEDYEQPDSEPTAGPRECLQALLDEHELTGEQLAEKVRVSVRAVQKFLAGESSLTASQAGRLGAYFKVDASVFLESSARE